ncbi:MAG: hypothetical protein A2909_03090 [Candidatus Tagabacteria bacterium RIFCSPLOWO2_01_FULL_39_11]|uniref:Uncharacterized protein n=1 Tax=Candidatus Tagabacteria bacterium RIFCSPLOWO2_01_FULL_39_11 TaxID=1802295 RepID=A0A1G2LR98_9BACT|nr:MAG: hypothetical protein A2909_03090 [Candidatus Tagabacteria bacterium RIFCSPLOWO2_01_FULL_39_11]
MKARTHIVVRRDQGGKVNFVRAIKGPKKDISSYLNEVEEMLARHQTKTSRATLQGHGRNDLAGIDKGSLFEATFDH